MNEIPSQLASQILEKKKIQEKEAKELRGSNEAEKTD